MNLRNQKLHFLLILTVLFAFISDRAASGDNQQTIRASRITSPIRIDGILDEELWKLAAPVTEFTQRDPDEGKPATERSEIRVVYDDEALYFGCMFYDNEPEQIVSRLTRRDNEIESDRASLRIDSYHDHQTGYEFTFNVAGVKIDILQYDDANREDDSWDPVWYVQTKINPQGWSAEVKIPFHILRYKSFVDDTAENVWGINFFRYISRKQESVRWAFTPKSQSGFISRFGHLTGLRNLPEPRQIGILPFVTSKQSYDPASSFRDRTQKFLGNIGVDFKYGLSSNFSLDGTINPDFGQVEADPAVLNLSTFETFYPEKRPFFVDGTQIIRFSTFGGDFGPGMFYSRRIGRAIREFEVSVPPSGQIIDMSNNTTILGAAKLTGKTNGGLSIGVLQAFTEKEIATVADSQNIRSQQILEPFAHYNVIRLRQDVLSNSNVGMIFTTVAKQSRAPAFTNGYDWNLKFENNTYSLDGFLALSHTTGRNDERITGSAGKTSFAKIAGEHWLWSLGADYTSKKYNINDVGFFFSPNDWGGVTSLTYKEDVPAKFVRNYNINTSVHYRDNFDGDNLFKNTGLHGQMLFVNYWRMTASAETDVGLYDQFETRGNGLYRKPVSYSTSTYLFSDERNDIIFKLGQRFAWDNKLKNAFATEVGVDIRPLSWMEWSVEGEHQKVINQEAWVTNVGGAPVFGDRTTDQYNMILRSTITFTRELTLQLYGQIFLAKGHYANFRELVGSSTFISTSFTSNSDFNSQSMNSNVVLRWEYLPGSTLFLVWSQARSNGDVNYFTSFSNDFNQAFQVPPSNVLLLKISYWWHI